MLETNLTLHTQEPCKDYQNGKALTLSTRNLPHSTAT